MSGALLSGTDLRDADLSDSDLSDATFSVTFITLENTGDDSLRPAPPVGYEREIGEIEADIARGHGARLDNAVLSGAKLSGANLKNAHLDGIDLTACILSDADLSDSSVNGAILVDADLTGARLMGAELFEANLGCARLVGASMVGTMLCWADLTGANLSGANLMGAYLIGTSLTRADLSNCMVYGASVWDVKLDGAVQSNLVITPPNEPTITADDLEVAQFLYLLLRNERLRNVIDTITSKVVLILGRFTEARKTTLDALRHALRQRNYLPVLFDFEKPRNRDFTETVSTLARLSRFVVADLTDPRSIPQELTALIFSDLFSVPIRPLLLGEEKEWAMFRDLARRPQVIAPFHYHDDAMLVENLESAVIGPAEQKAQQLIGR